MTKLEELKAAREAAYDVRDAAVAAIDAAYANRDDDDIWDAAARKAVAALDAAAVDACAAYEAELKKTQEENPMTKLEELEAAIDAAYANRDADDIWDAAARKAVAALDAVADVARDAYEAELKKIQTENSND